MGCGRVGSTIAHSLEVAGHSVAVVDQLRQFLTAQVDAVVTGPARNFRSAVQMSEMASFTDAGHPLDATNWSNTVLSYYTYGAAIALAMDLSLRERSDNTVTLDEYMRAMWRVHGKPGGTQEGYVDRPYTIGDAEHRLVDITGDRAFAHEFFSRYIEGREVVDYDADVAQITEEDERAKLELLIFRWFFERRPI